MYTCCSTLTQALEQGDAAIEAIVDYSSILNMLGHVRDLSDEIHITLQHILYQSINNLPPENGISSGQLLYSSQSQSSEVHQLLALIDSAVDQEAHASDIVARLDDTVTRLLLDVTMHRRATNLAVLEINQTLFRVTDQFSMVDKVSGEILSSSLLNTTFPILAGVNVTQSVNI